MAKLTELIENNAVTGIFIVETHKEEQARLHFFLGEEDEDNLLQWIGILDCAKDFVKALDGGFDYESPS